MSVNLEELATEIAAMAEKVKTLKADGADGDVVKAAVDALLAVKQTYANNNGGLGVDGQPYEPPLTKAQKKAKAKAEKEAATQSASGAAQAAVSERYNVPFLISFYFVSAPTSNCLPISRLMPRTPRMHRKS